MDGSGPSRRTLVLGGGALAAGAWLGVHVWGHLPLPARSTQALGASGLDTLTAVFEVMSLSPARAREDAAGVDAFLSGGDPVQAEQLRLALLVLEHLGGVGLFTPLRFSRQSVEARTAVLQEWEASVLSPKRQIFQALRRTVVFTWASQPRNWGQLAYEGPWVGTKGAPP